MALAVELHKLVIVLEGELAIAAVHNDVVLLGEGNGSAVLSVESDGIVLAEMLLQEFLGNLVSHNVFLLNRWCRNCIHRVPAWFR